MNSPIEEVGRNISNHSDKTDYNRVLEYYIEESDSEELDLVGLVAYGLYKRQKRDWIVQYRNENCARKPSREEVDAVTSSYLTEDLKNTLRSRASDILSGYADTYVQAIEPQIKIDALNHELLRQASAIESSIKAKSNFWSQVVVGIVSTALWTILVTGVVLTGALFGSDLIDGLNKFSSAIH